VQRELPELLAVPSADLRLAAAQAAIEESGKLELKK
jgi:hypothetical protein